MFGTLLVLIGLGVVVVPMRSQSAAVIKTFCIVLLIVICVIVGWDDVRGTISR